jgi:hypothetical protein
VQDILIGGICGGNVLANGGGPDVAIDFGGVYPGGAYATLLTNLDLGLVRHSAVPAWQEHYLHDGRRKKEKVHCKQS